MDLERELKNIINLHAYCVTGDQKYLRDREQDSLDFPDFTQESDVGEVAPHQLVPSLVNLMLCKGCAVEEYERAREAVEKALYELWRDW